MSCFRPEILYGGHDCYIIERIGQFLDKLKEHMWLAAAERGDFIDEFSTLVPIQRSRKLPSKLFLIF